MKVSWKVLVLTVSAAVLATAALLHRRDVRRAEEAATLRRAIAMLDVRPPKPLEANTVDRKKPEEQTIAGTKPGRPVAGPEDVPEGAYHNAGWATATAAYHTLAWLCDRGDAEALAEAIMFEPKAREWIVAYHGQLSPEARARWQTPEQMAAALYVSAVMMRPFPAAAILELAEEEQVGPGRIKIRLPGTGKDGLQFQQEPDGWRFVITEEMVNSYLAQKSPAAGK